MPFILSVVRFGILKEKIMLASCLFNLIRPLQYALGVRYFRKPHFRTIMADCKRNFIDIPSEKKTFLWIFGVTVVGAICLSVIIGVTGLFPPEFQFIIDGIRNNQKDMIFEGELVPGMELGDNISGPEFGWILLVLIEWIFSALSLATNLVIFSLVFDKHLKDITEMKDHLESEFIWKMDQTSFTELTRKIIGLRFVINQSVDHLESFYTTFTILGAFAIGPIVEFKVIDSYLIYLMVIYFTCQVIFVYFIYYISKNREDILKIIKSPTVMFKFLTNVKSMHNVEVLRHEMQELRRLDPERVHTLNKFKIAAYSPVVFEDIADLEHGMLTADNSYDNASVRHSSNSSHSELVQNKAMAELLTLNYKNNAAIDWIILQDVLREKWTSFNLLGISFDDSDVIKKSVGMTSVIILASSYINSLTLLN
jgi:hypothetical protein